MTNRFLNLTGESIAGRKIDRDTPLLIPYVSLHRNKEWWDQPDTFNPDRWLGESPIKHPLAFLPFSTGPRACPASQLAEAEYKIILATFLRRFSFTVPRDLAYRGDYRQTDPDIKTKESDRACLPVGFEVAFSEGFKMQPRECLVEVVARS